MNSLKNKIASNSKELDFISKKNISLKNDIDSHVYHAIIDSSSINKHVSCSTSSSTNENDICMLKKSVDCLGSTLSQCAMNHTRLESIFERNILHLCMHTNHDIHIFPRSYTQHHVCSCVHLYTLWT